MKKLCSAFIVVTIIVFQSSDLVAQDNFKFETYTYFHSDTLNLQLDYFEPDSLFESMPLVIFVHGGGFSGGNRGGGHEFCSFLAENGIPAATITYTLYMQGKDFGCGGVLPEKVKAIQFGAFDARLATTWFIKNAENFGIDTNKIFLAGSSAGAEAVLQAAFWDTSAVNFFPDTLSDCFSYAGLISGAGALLDLNMIHRGNSIPCLCFHGTCDPLVPYYIAAHHYCGQITPGYMMMFGGLAIYERLEELNVSCQLMTFCGEGHEHAGTGFHGPFMKNSLEFINRTLQGEKFSIHRVFNNGTECSMNLDFIHCNNGNQVGVF